MDIEAPIVAVTVYTDRAQVTRRGKVRLEAGAQELALCGLPVKLDADSLRAGGQGEIAVQIVGVESRQRPTTESPHATLHELEIQIRDLEDALKLLHQRAKTLERRSQIVAQLADNAAKRYASALAEGEASLDAAAQLLDFVAAQTDAANARRATLEVEMRENVNQTSALRTRQGQLNSAHRNMEVCVTVSVEAGSAGEWELELIYTVPNASWKPLYDVRVTTALSSSSSADGDAVPHSSLKLGYSALIFQHTGEDWNDVRLTLSTARPGLGTLPPKLDPIYVNVYAPVTLSPEGLRRARSGEITRDGVTLAQESSGSPFAGAPMPAAAFAAAPPPPEPIIAEEATADIDTDGSTATFGLPRPLSVPSDGRQHRAQITTEELPCRLDYQAIPRRVPFAYLRAVVTNATALTLLEGDARVFRDGTFIGGTHLKGIAPNGEIILFLGPDESVRAERELTLREVDKNFIGNQRRTHFAYALNLQNLKPHPIQLTVQDQIPVSRSEQIKVKLRGAEPNPQVSDLGILTWELTLQPNEKRALRYDYALEAPRDVTIAGVSD